MVGERTSALTLEGQILAKVDLHCLLRALCTTFRIVNNGFLTDSKTNHWRVLRPFLEVCGNAIPFRQDLLENVVCCTRAHRDSRAATFDTRPRDDVTDGEMVGVVWV